MVEALVCELTLFVSFSRSGALSTTQLSDCPAIIDTWARAALAVNPFVIVLCHGGPIASPEDAQVMTVALFIHF